MIVNANNNRYLKSIVDDCVIACDEIINVMDSVSTNVRNTNLINATKIFSINSDNKKIRHKMDCFVLHTSLLVTILLFMIAIIISLHKIWNISLPKR